MPATLTPSTDADYVEQTRRGDLDAFAVLVERHRDVVFRVAARVVDPAEAEDVSQEAFLKAFHQLPRFRGESSFRSWLLTITHNTALNALERRSRWVPEPEPQETEGWNPVGPRTPVERLEQRERRERLEAKLRLLKPNHRVVLVLRDVEGLSYDEIAEVTGAPLGSVKGRLSRAREELIELLRTNTYDWSLPR